MVKQVAKLTALKKELLSEEELRAMYPQAIGWGKILNSPYPYLCGYRCSCMMSNSEGRTCAFTRIERDESGERRAHRLTYAEVLYTVNECRNNRCCRTVEDVVEHLHDTKTGKRYEPPKKTTETRW